MTNEENGPRREGEPIPRRDPRESCPRCGFAESTELGRSRSEMILFSCPRCDHVWLRRDT